MEKTKKLIGFKLIQEYPGSKGLGYFEPLTTGEFVRYQNIWKPVYIGDGPSEVKPIKQYKMEIIIKTKIECHGRWDSKAQGAVFVGKEEHIEPVFKTLCEQDDCWEHYKELIQAVPKEIGSEFVLKQMCDYCGKTDIYDVKQIKEKLKEQGIEIILYQYFIDFNE